MYDLYTEHVCHIKLHFTAFFYMWFEMVICYYAIIAWLQKPIIFTWVGCSIDFLEKLYHYSKVAENINFYSLTNKLLNYFWPFWWAACKFHTTCMYTECSTAYSMYESIQKTNDCCMILGSTQKSLMIQGVC